jgi:glycosyltransferase involved in cell wall biosynthesis
VRVLVATSDVPFVEGGHRVIARALVQALQESGHQAELLTTPTNRFGRQFASYTATRFTDAERTGNGEPVDRLISLRYPSYALKHPHHVCWLNHRMREYYDLWSNWSGSLSWKGRIKEGIRKKIIHAADSYFLKKNVRKVFAQSGNVQKQLRKWGNIPSEILYPPAPGKGYYNEKYGDFILSPARLIPLKRVSLLLDALRISKFQNAVIAGDGTEMSSMVEWVRANSLENKIRFLGHVSSQDLIQLYAECRAVYYAPLNEDFGMVTMEAFQSRKPLITCDDSGGPAELVRNGVTGFTTAPSASALSDVITNLFEDASLAEKIGTAGYAEWNHVNWPNTVSKLLE